MKAHRKYTIYIDDTVMYECDTKQEAMKALKAEYDYFTHSGFKVLGNARTGYAILSATNKHGEWQQTYRLLELVHNKRK